LPSQLISVNFCATRPHASAAKWAAERGLVQGSGSEEGLLTGYGGLDGEHQMQLELLTAFRRAVEDTQECAALDEILDELVDYTKVHFSSEQLLMRLYQYPSYQEHVDDHERTIERLEDLRRAQFAGGKAMALEAADELSERMFAHIRSADRALGHFLARLGVGPG
jgi:hemerythrin